MNNFFKKNKIIIYLILLFNIIIITNCGNFINNDQNTGNTSILVDTNNTIKLPNQVKINIKYHLPSSIYNSKDELFNDFIKDLYEYIITNHPSKGIPHLKSLNINSVEDALKICKDWNDNDSTGLPLVGKAFSPFFLHNDAGGTFERQKEKDCFVGYCFKENKYIDFLYFLKTFFYHFRIDEGYTIINFDGSITNPEGSDFFASSYASIIDTAKFFYYTKDTLPYYFISLKHIPELYDKIPGVLKTPFNREEIITYDTTFNKAYPLPNTFNCYGYKFLGWNESDNSNIDYIDKIDNSLIENHILDIFDNDKLTIDLYANFDNVSEFNEELNK